MAQNKVAQNKAKILAKPFVWLRANLRRLVYSVIALTAVVWACTFLYFHSFNNVFGGIAKSEGEIKSEFAAAEKKLKALVSSGGSADTIYDERLKLALRYDQNLDYKAALVLLLAEKADLLKMPDSETVLTRRIKVEDYIAHIDLDDGKFVEARECVVRAAGLAQDLEDRFSVPHGRALRLSMVNENGIVFYLEANGTIDTKVRTETYAHSRAVFEDVIAQIDSLEHDGSKFDPATQAILADIKRHAGANLKLLKEDLQYEYMFRKTS